MTLRTRLITLAVGVVTYAAGVLGLFGDIDEGGFLAVVFGSACIAVAVVWPPGTKS